MAAIADAGVKQIDYLISTHYHVDHVGGMQELAKRIPIGTSSITVRPSKVRVDPAAEQVPPGLPGGVRRALRQGEAHRRQAGRQLPITGLDWRIVTSGGTVLKTPLPGGGKPNPLAPASRRGERRHRDPDNGQSVGSVITFGQFRAIDLGDLLWNKEHDLMCPNNPIGTVDLLFRRRTHGTDPSGSPALVHGLQPRVARRCRTARGRAPARRPCRRCGRRRG